VALKPGRLAKFSIAFANDRWNLALDGKTFGFYAESWWNGAFTKVGKIQAYGEVESTSKTTPRAGMGNGILGTKPGSVGHSAREVDRREGNEAVRLLRR